MAASQTLAEMRESDPAHAAYVDKLIEWCRSERGAEKASVAAEVVRGIVHQGDVEWQVLVETFGTPTIRDWSMAMDAYGPAPHRLHPVVRCPQCGLDIAWSPVFEDWMHGEDSNSSYRCTYLDR